MEPQSILGVAKLTEFAFSGADMSPIRAELLADCLQGTATSGSLMDLAVIEQLCGNQEIGVQWQTEALRSSRFFRTHRDRAAKRRVLVVCAQGHMGLNTPVEFLLRHSDFEVVAYYPDADQPLATALPEHDVVFCAAPADADGAEAFFARMKRDFWASAAPFVNVPQTYLSLQRDTVARAFSAHDGIVAPKTLRVKRELLEVAARFEVAAQALDDLAGYPYVVRPVGSHAGAGLAKIETPAALATYLTTQHEAEFYVSDFVDYASRQDGKYRKYRIVFVGDQAFPVHMAIADRWDVWYMNADMQASVEKRAEEAAFFETFSHDFARRHAEHFKDLTQTIGLDYVGIDCAEDADGNLVVFEADNALIVHDMDSRAVFPYKPAAMQAVFQAFETLLHDRCRMSFTTAPAPEPRALTSYAG